MADLLGILLLTLLAGAAHAATSANYAIFPDTIDSGGGRQASAAYSNHGSIGIIEGTSAAGGTVLFHGFIAQLEGGIVAVIYPPGDVNGSSTVTGADSLLINQVIVGLRSNTHPVFAIAGYLNGDVNQTNGVTSGDSLLINQTVQSLRSYVVTKVLPSARATTNTVTSVTIYGIGFPTNGTAPSAMIGAPVNLPLSNLVVLSEERLTAIVPPGGGAGTGLVTVAATQTNGVISFGRFSNP